jgi:predicted permease
MQDLTHAFKTILRSPGFAMAGIGSLALAIAANTIVFGVLSALLLRPLPIERPDEVFFMQRGSGGSHSFPLYRDIRSRARQFSDFAAYRIAPMALQTEAGSERLWGYLATGNYFELLGVKPAIGRFFRPDEDITPNGAPYAVLSYAAWRARFAGDSAIAGRVIRLNGRPFTILGVAPDGFRGTELFYVPEVWVPMMMQPHIEGNSWLENPGTHNTSVLARIKTGVSKAQAEEELNAIGAVLGRELGWNRVPRFTLATPGLVGDLLRAPVTAFSVAVMLLAGLVLLAACVNLSALFVVRSLDRMREMGIKLALGAGRARISRELVFEVLLLVAAGGAGGWLVAHYALLVLTRWRIPVELPTQFDVQADFRVILFVVGVASVAALMSAVAPVWRAWRVDPNSSLRASREWDRSSRWPLRDVLLAVQIACCCVLVTAGIVAFRGLSAAFQTHVAMDVDEVTVTGFDLSLAGYTGARGRDFQRRALEAVQSIPGVTSAAYGNSAPLFIDQSTTGVAPDPPDPSQPSVNASYYQVSPGYLGTLGTRLVTGRDFTWQDEATAPLVAIVNETFAGAFGNSGKIGWRFRRGAGGPPIEVVGIVEDGKYQTLTESPRRAVFFPILQQGNMTTMIVARSSRPQAEIASEIRERLRQLDADLPLYALGGLDAALAFVFVPAWAATITLNAFAALAAVLIATGVYGLAAYTVARRTREISIRVAVGARPAHVLKAVLARTGTLMMIGALSGIALGVAASKVLASVVYQASSSDPFVVLSAGIAITTIALCATWLPARRALRIDPVRALRED